MLQKRLILTLLYQQRYFQNSRQFNIQNCTNIPTVLQYINFEAIDELVILNVDRENKVIADFCEDLKLLTKKCFVPITAGGGISSLDDIKLLLNSGADKVAINTACHDNPELVIKAAQIYGSQCIVASVDYKLVNGKRIVFVNNGTMDTGLDVFDYCDNLVSLGVGEIYLTSIDHDGIGDGYDLDTIKLVADKLTIPVIASGGVQHFSHLEEGIKKGGASAVSLANIFHYTGYEGLKKAKEFLLNEDLGFAPALWNF